MNDPRQDPPAQPLLEEQIARLKNEPLLQMIKSVEGLRRDLEQHAFQVLFLRNQKDDLQSFTKEVKTLKEALDREYGRRLLHSYQSQYQRMLATLDPPQDQEGIGFRLIPLRAGIQAEATEAEPGSDDLEHAIQAATALFQDHLHALLTRAREAATAPNEKGGSHEESAKQ